jgi:1-deoxy-D-xylulose-5-phosphate reductoisomerase
MSSPARITLLGATGSIGASTLDVMRSPGPAGRRFTAAALTAQTNVKALIALCLAYRPDFAVIGDEGLYQELRDGLSGSGIACGSGRSGLIEAAERPADCVVSAIVGIAGLPATHAAVRAGRTVALANKESLVCAGRILAREAEASGARLIPIDSEHNAIFQVLDRPERVEKLILTASGGPFRNATREEMARATPAQAVRHPNWSMGAKISVDSATMMNKGLELIEATHLFGVASERIQVLVHPQSIIHSLVSYDDGSVLAQLGMPDMRTPISYALAWPHRMPMPGVDRLDLAKIARLDFEAPDPGRFPALAYAREAAAAGGGAGIALNGANEAAVAAFLQGRIGFLDIAEVAGKGMERMVGRSGRWEPSDIDEVYAADAEARVVAREAIDACGKLAGGVLR